MDYTSVCSETIESLDYLRPPVKRPIGSPGSVCNVVGGIRVLKHFRTKFTKKTQFPQTKRRGVGTSSSLILNNTAKKEVAENYAVLSYSNLFGSKENERNLLTKQILGVKHKEKPLVKVTVTPKTVQTQTTNILKKKRFGKKVQATVSNQEINSIKAKNLFLVVGGQKEKVYEFKRTGSAKLVNNKIEKCKDDNVSLDQMSSLKLVLESLNMNRQYNEMTNKRASRRLCDSPDCPFAPKHQGSEMYKECACSNTAKGDNDVNTRRSCVRVTGRLGLTEDDRYVLKCNTTIDDEPVDSVRYYTAPREDRRVTHTCNAETCPVLEGLARKFRCQKDELVELRNKCCGNNDTKSNHQMFKVCACCDRVNCSFKAKDVCSSFSKKDCNIQVNLPDVRRTCQTASASCGTTSRSQKCQSSASTQVNFKVGFTNPECYTCISPAKDEIIQCCCSNEEEESSSGSECDVNCLKRCQSPMVVISVYPMQSDSENVKVVTDPPIDKRFLSIQKSTKINKTEHNSKNNSTEINTTKKTGRESRSANNSPSKSRSRSRSPQSKTQSKTNINENKVLRTNVSRKSSPVRDKNTSPRYRNTSPTNHPVRIKQDKPISNIERYKSSSSPGRWSKKIIHKGTNTDHNATKKLLVDNYTKHLTALMQGNNPETNCDCKPQNDSKVDGNRENFGIKFNQGVKDSKNIKMKIDSKRGRSHNDSVSPKHKNLHMVPEKDPKQRSLSQSAYKDEQQNEESFTRLRVRDSLEISHRREGSHHSHCGGLDSRTNCYNKEKPSGIKHYRGDSCSITDPLERDQEIRALLGVDKGNHTGTSMAHSVNHMRQRCEYDNKCFNNLQNVEALQKRKYNKIDECVCTDVMKKYYCNQSNTTVSKGENYHKTISKTSMHNDRIANGTKFDLRINQSTNTIVKMDNKISNDRMDNDTVDNARNGDDSGSDDKINSDSVDDDRIPYTKNGYDRKIIKRISTDRISNEGMNCDCNSYNRINKGMNENAGNISSSTSSEPSSNCCEASVCCECPKKSVTKHNNKDVEEYSEPTENRSFENAGNISSSTSSEPTYNSGSTVCCECPKKSVTKHNNGAVEEYSEPTENRSSTNTKKVNCACPTNSTEKLGLDKFLKCFVNKKSVSAITKGTQYEDEPVDEDAPMARGQRTSLYQQLILNRNIQIFLQVEQFSKQKPIVLSRKQYDKVKRTIDSTILNKSRRKTCICKTSLVSVGEIRRKTNRPKSILPNIEAETQQQSSSDESQTDSISSQELGQKTFFVITGEKNQNDKNRETHPKVASTVEFRCASMSYTKYVTFSSTNVEAGSTASALDGKESLSLHTIFKGHRRCASPNLGTSVYSLNSDDDVCLRPAKQPPLRESKSKKPLLKRLMSCLVMRSRVADINHQNASPPLSNKPSVGSTFDAYHINSSFCGVDMSSSMYDTSISFYTNHSVYPINSKIKRGFFNSSCIPKIYHEEYRRLPSAENVLDLLAETDEVDEEGEDEENSV